jgi:hypothetical protein
LSLTAIKACCVAAFLTLTLVTVAHAGLKSLVNDYSRAKKKIGGTAEAKAKYVKEELAPLLIEIGKLDSTPSLGFLDREYRGARGALAVSCAKAMLENSSVEALGAVVTGLQKKSPGTLNPLLDMLAASDRDFAPVEKAVLGLLASKSSGGLEGLPAVVAKLNNLLAAKSLLKSVRAPKGKSVVARQARTYNSKVVEALAKFDGDDVKAWLSDGAWKRGSDARTEVLLRVAGALKLEEARVHIVDNVSHSQESVAVAAIAALQAVGIGDAHEEIAAAFGKMKKRSANFKIQFLDALAMSESDEALNLVLEIAKTGDPTMRAISMGSLSLSANADLAFPGLVQGLADEDEDVRNAALRAFHKYRSKAMIAPLIAFMEKENVRKLKIDALRHLIRVTGKNMGLEIEDWKSWWDVTEASFELPEEKKEFTSVKMRGLEYFGLEVSSDRLLFLADISSSMTAKVPIKKRLEEAEEEETEKGKTRVRKKKKKPDSEDEDEDDADDGDKDGDDDKTVGEAPKIDILKKELVRVLKKLPVGTSINITSFDANFKSWKKTLHPLKGKGRAEVVQFVEALRTGSGTNVFDTLEHALKDKRVDTIFLLTDGVPSAGRIKDPALIAAEIRTLNRIRGATIHCIAFGEESPLLKTLAAENGGQYRFVDRY